MLGAHPQHALGQFNKGSDYFDDLFRRDFKCNRRERFEKLITRKIEITSYAKFLVEVQFYISTMVRFSLRLKRVHD